MEPDIPVLVKELRKRLHLTREHFARKVGVTYPTLGSTAGATARRPEAPCRENQTW